MIRTMFTILVFLSFSQAVAQEKKSGWAKGFIPCGAFLSECEKDMENINCVAQNSFTMGFISGASVIGGIPIEPFDDRDSIKYALVKYCKENPLKSTVLGAIDILEQLK